jgi:hypothetical protein
VVHSFLWLLLLLLLFLLAMTMTMKMAQWRRKRFLEYDSIGADLSTELAVLLYSLVES